MKDESGAVRTSFKDKAVARMLVPESAPAEQVAREVGISAGTERPWRNRRAEGVDGCCAV
jgi:hypothetical protein